MTQELFSAHLTTTILSLSGDLDLSTEWVSSTGIVVRWAAPPPVLTLVRMRMTLPNDGAVALLFGVVTGVVATADSCAPRGVTIAFYAKGGADAVKWDRYVDSLRACQPPFELGAEFDAVRWPLTTGRYRQPTLSGRYPRTTISVAPVPRSAPPAASRFDTLRP